MKMKNKRKVSTKVALIILIIIISVLVIRAVMLGGAIGLLILGGFLARPEVTTDIQEYNNVIGVNAKDVYESKWGMSEDIFPAAITTEMKIDDFKMVYYDPWDKQFLSYLVVDYAPEDYAQEVERLQEYPSTSYKGYYSVEGFGKAYGQDYELLAMEADDYLGFVYALTDGQERIVYVELIFCNYFMDLEYKEYIREEYLPIGFDASMDNEYKAEIRQNLYDEILCFS